MLPWTSLCVSMGARMHALLPCRGLGEDLLGPSRCLCSALGKLPVSNDVLSHLQL